MKGSDRMYGELFCGKCKNMVKKTPSFDLCYSCAEIDYIDNDSKRTYVYFTSDCFAFLALRQINSKLLGVSTDLQDHDEMTEYFLIKREYFPNHIFDTNNRELKVKYLREIDSAFSQKANHGGMLNSNLQDAFSHSLTVLKEILYGQIGRTMDVDPTKQGKFVDDFKKCKHLILQVLKNLKLEYVQLHYCDICNILGEREKLTDNNTHHPYDGCIWCI